MARGYVRKRCQCRDGEGKPLKGCKKPHGSWQYTLEGTADPTTRRRRPIVQGGYRTKAEADEAMTEAQRAVDMGTWRDDRRTTVAAWLDRWLTDNKGRLSPKTLANYRGHVRDVWTPLIGHVRLRELQRGHIEDALTEIGKPVERRPGNVGRHVQMRAGGTIEGYRRTLRAALSAAQRRGLIAVNPATDRFDAIPTTEDPDLTIWEPEATAHFLEHVSAERLAGLYELAAYAGLRRAELCGARWQDIDPDGAALVVRQTLIELASKDLTPAQRRCPVCREEHKGRLLKPPKSRKGKRWVPLAPPAQAALAVHRMAQDVERAILGTDYSDHGLIFCEPDGTPLRPSQVTRAFVGHVEACGLPEIRLHDMRHGACSLLISGGVPVEVVQLIMGHSSPAVTRKVYAHTLRGATAEQVTAAMEGLSRYRRRQSVVNPGDSGE